MLSGERFEQMGNRTAKNGVNRKRRGKTESYVTRTLTITMNNSQSERLNSFLPNFRAV